VRNEFCESTGRGFEEIRAAKYFAYLKSLTLGRFLVLGRHFQGALPPVEVFGFA
jgi:hypothetical protein